MNRLTAPAMLLALALSSFTVAFAQAVHQASGVVKSVNVEKGSVTIAHGPVATLKWPSMTMGFSADDRELLQNLKAGAKVEFEFVRQGSRYVITSIK
jgi:Cu(I)/Ag(I) efflux system protein CusF